MGVEARFVPVWIVSQRETFQLYECGENDGWKHVSDLQNISQETTALCILRTAGRHMTVLQFHKNDILDLEPCLWPSDGSVFVAI